MATTKEQWHAARNPPADPCKDPTVSFKDKTILVTGAFGANSLGHHAAIKYAALGANPLILAVRTQQKGEQAKASIIRETNCSPDIFIIETVDLSNFASVVNFANRIIKRVPSLHVVQLAAGVATVSYAQSPEGYEMALQVDVLSTILLALLLLPKLRETAAKSPSSTPHLSFLNSLATFMIADKDPMLPPQGGQTLTQHLNDEKAFNAQHQYFLIKLATWYAIQGIVEIVDRENIKTPNSQVVINATCPGLCKTDMVRDIPFVFKIMMNIKWHFLGRTAENGARTLVSATALGSESHGRLWTNDRYLR